VLDRGRVVVDDASGTALLSASDGRVTIVMLPECAAPR
jgi:hypothetical protein